MKQFHNILVGVDLFHADPLGSTHFRPAADDAIERAIWLAERQKARLTFFSAVDIPQSGQYLLEDDRRRVVYHTQKTGEQVMDQLVRRARDRGITAVGRVEQGRAWVEILRQVLRDCHDLLIVGAADQHVAWRFVLSNTATRLLHNCPCPVWVTRPQLKTDGLRVLVASDLSAVSIEALQIGLALGSLADGRVDLLHVIDDPLASVWSTGLAETSSRRYVENVRVDAQRVLAEQLARTGDPAAVEVDVHVVKGSRLPDIAILDFIDKHRVDLLVIATIARGGAPGVLVGNTAERLLPCLRCSLLAVKPNDFQCPVTLEAEHQELPSTTGFADK